MQATLRRRQEAAAAASNTAAVAQQQAAARHASDSESGSGSDEGEEVIAPAFSSLLYRICHATRSMQPETRHAIRSMLGPCMHACIPTGP